MKLTRADRHALEILLRRHEAHPSVNYGFRSAHLGQSVCSACRRNLEALGLVKISRVVSNGYRYALTDAGFTEARRLKEHRS